GPGREPALGGLLPRPTQRGLPRAECPEDLLVHRAVQPPVFAAPQGVHHHQGGAATVLALVPLLPPRLPAPPLPSRPAAVPGKFAAPPRTRGEWAAPAHGGSRR